jgi:cytochrome c oxidase subunit III
MSTVTLDRPARPAPPAPPADGGRGDDGRGGGGGRDGSDDTFGSSGPPFSVSRIGLFILIGSIVMLFAGFLTVYMILRFSAPEWPPKTLPPLPSGLWVSTALIALSSVSASFWVRAAKRRNFDHVKAWLLATFILGTSFCATQALCWQHVFERGLDIRTGQYAASFYCLTAVHFVHILGGLYYMLLAYLSTARRLLDDGPAKRRGLMERLANCAIYWHFVGGLWYLLFAVIYLY